MGYYVARLGVALAFAALAAACGSVSQIDDTSEAAESIPESTMPAFVAEAQCNQQLSCDCYLESGPVGEDAAEYTRNKCLENRELELSHWQGRMRGYGLRYDSECVEKKLALAQEWGCGDGLDVAEIELAGSDCGSHCRVYHGDVPVGQVCDPSFDACAQGAVCRTDGYDPVTGQSTYRCTSACAGAGERCSYEECAPGLFCRYSGGETSRCDRLPLKGEACIDYTCGASMCNESNVCVAYAEDGAACDPAIPCRGNCVDSVCQQGPARICIWDLRAPF